MTANVMESRLDQLRTWDAGAKHWALPTIAEHIKAANRPLTVAQVLTYLDTLPAPAGYEVMRSDYVRRYHWVRRILNSMLTRGELVSVPTVNARKRASAAFALPSYTQATPKAQKRRRKPAGSSYEVLVEGSQEVKGRLEDWLRQEGIGPQQLKCALIDFKGA